MIENDRLSLATKNLKAGGFYFQKIFIGLLILVNNGSDNGLIMLGENPCELTYGMLQ